MVAEFDGIGTTILPIPNTLDDNNHRLGYRISLGVIYGRLERRAA